MGNKSGTVAQIRSAVETTVQTFGRAMPMIMRHKFFASLAAAAAMFVVSGTQNAEAAPLTGKSVKIGCMASVTGKGAEWGSTAKLSMEIAVEEINAKGGVGGVPMELICYDTQTLEAEALKVVSR